MVLNKEQAKSEIQKLIDKYNKVVEEKRFSKYNEEMTKKDFILPLFRALGWNVEDSSEVTAEEKISKKRVDYGFRINGISKFFLEAKALKEDLDNIEFIKQAINYAWHKGCTWAILIDFEHIKIFNSEWKLQNPAQAQFGQTLFCKSFLEQFDQLFLLSRESFELGLIDKEAEKWGRKAKKISVDKQLLQDFTKFRELLSKNINKLNEKQNLSEEQLDEAIQRILNRLIFIRNCEDREFEQKQLIANIREWKSAGRGQLVQNLREVFRYFDRQYNSKLFAFHLCDELKIDDEVLYEIIEGLYYTSDKSIFYDFSAIEADVLGNIYEQYLGHLLNKSAKRAKLSESQAHRKEQGIYYTPTYIVDYIVRNTLGELLKDKKVNVEKLRILDPACGSGSFLIKTFDILNDYYKKKENYSQKTLGEEKLTYSTKERILKNNIFGVDLDKQAIEVAQLNLLLKIAERGHSLPLLQQNIKNGNSLIDDPTVAGDKAFKWENEFKEVMQEGGFDVVIGNPPYVRPENVSKKERDYYLSSKKFDKFFGRFDLYVLFIERALKLLKSGGYFSFIIPYSFLNQNYSKILREWILKEFKIVSIVDLSQIKVFESAEVNTCILVIQKLKPKREYNLKILKPINLITLNNSPTVTLRQDIFITTPQFMIRTDLDDKKINVISKITKDTLPCSEIFYVVIGSVPHDSKTGASKDRLISSTKSGDSFKKYIEGKDMSRYNLDWRHIYLNYLPKMMHRPKFPELFENEKLIVRNISTKEGLLSVYDDSYYFTNDTVSLCVPWFKLKDVNIKGENITPEMIDKSKKYNLKYCMGLINSKVLNFYFKQILSSNLHVYPEAIRNLPIKIISDENQRQIIRLVDKMLSLNKRLNEIGDKKTDERARIEEEIKKTDAEIDELVYKLYGITEEEKKIIEKSLTK